MSPDSLRITFVIPIASHSKVHQDLEIWVNSPLVMNHEVILIVDHTDRTMTPSTKTLGVLDRIERASPSHIKVLRTQAGNPGTPRNLGIENASGEWIFFWDADDFPRIQESLDLVHGTKESGAEVGVGFVEIHGNRRRFIRNSWYDIYRWPGLWRFTFKTDLIKRLKFEEWAWCEDQKFLVETLISANYIYRGNRIVYEYTLNSHGALTSIRENWTALTYFLEYLKLLESKDRKSLVPFLFHLKSIVGLTRYLSFKETSKNFFYFLRSILQHRPHNLPRLIHQTSRKSTS